MLKDYVPHARLLLTGIACALPALRRPPVFFFALQTLSSLPPHAVDIVEAMNAETVALEAAGACLVCVARRAVSLSTLFVRLSQRRT